MTPEDDELEDVLPSTPDCTMSDEDVEALPVVYSTRGPKDWVLSGPLGVHGGGPGRRFATIAQARAHVEQLHPGKVKERITEATINGRNRWAFLIRGDR